MFVSWRVVFWGQCESGVMKYYQPPKCSIDLHQVWLHSKKMCPKSNMIPLKNSIAISKRIHVPSSLLSIFHFGRVNPCFLTPAPPKHKNMPRTDAGAELGELFLAWHKRFRWFQDPTKEMNWSFEDPKFLEVFSKIKLIPGWHCLMFLIKNLRRTHFFQKYQSSH